ncbi:MAG: leucine-rich repeat protein [Clostridia bacterium]|nr:leucine-rich repeat protein [Clostridia bacterium]
MKSNLSFLIFIFILLSFLCSCNATEPSGSETTVPSYHDAQIAELMRQLDELRKSNQQQSQAYELLSQKLQEALEQLSSEAQETTEPLESESDSTTGTEETDGRFLYTTDGIYATIVGFTGKDTTLVIPSQIDGYFVQTIGEQAFAASALEQVTVSPGVERIDWFAFRDCAALRSIYLPASITSIGHGAFDGCASGLTVSCPKDSYAAAYAEGYGLAVASP